MLLQYMRQALLCIVTKCLQKDYVGAMDQYVKLALYGAPSPIGITMVDIYERVGRDKIFSNVAAQASADEMAHKFLQSVKRLMTLCQRRYPAALSKPIECNGYCNGPQSLLHWEIPGLRDRMVGERMHGVVSNGSHHFS
ncbi:hypothetical protein L7F22_008982 [Adiantum nelumboides]|nr:hypothetical protein [Adiantum nelumboides]